MNTIGVILAGGMSSRMGQDKALLKIKNASMLMRTYQLLRQTSVSDVVICRNDNAPQHIADIYPNKGPLAGIHSAAMRCPNSNLLVVPIDLPLLDVSTLKRVLDSGEKFNRNTRFDAHCLPFYLCNTPSTRQILDYSLRCTNNYSVKRFCSHFPLTKLRLSRQSSLFNSNTPDQWRFAMELFETPNNNQSLEANYGTC